MKKIGRWAKKDICHDTVQVSRWEPEVWAQFLPLTKPLEMRKDRWNNFWKNIFSYLLCYLLYFSVCLKYHNKITKKNKKEREDTSSSKELIFVFPGFGRDWSWPCCSLTFQMTVPCFINCLGIIPQLQQISLHVEASAYLTNMLQFQ